jgi:hypothetical protein
MAIGEQLPERRLEYLGDGLYATFDGYQIRLFASNGLETTNEVFLEPHVFSAFMRYASSIGWTPK